MLFAQGLTSPEALVGVGEELAAAVEAAEENPKGQEEENNEHSEKRTHLPLQVGILNKTPPHHASGHERAHAHRRCRQ